MSGDLMRFRPYLKFLKHHLSRRDVDVDPVEYFVLDDRRLVFVVVSKVACTSIKATIGRSYGVRPERASGLDIHLKPEWCSEFRRLSGDRAAYTRFAFVRNPLSRLVSCYEDKILWDGPTEDYPAYYFRDDYYSLPPNIAFGEFVRRVARIPDYLADRHFKGQSYTLYRRGGFRVDHIGRFERLAEDWAALAARFGLEPELAHYHKSTGKRRARRDYRDYYDRATLELVYRRYRDDFERFGYRDEYDGLRASL